MQIPRYVVGSLLFALIWAAITYTQHGWEPKRLLGGVLAFFIVGSVLSWFLTMVVKWFRNRR